MKITVIAKIKGMGIKARIVDVDTFNPVKYLRDHPHVIEVQTEAFDDEAGEYVMTTPLHRDQVNPHYL